MTGHPRPSRRTVLLGGLACVAAACRPKRPPRAPGTKPTDDDAIVSARQVELDVVSTYTAAMQLAGPTAQAVIAPLLEDHKRHLSALGHGTGRTLVLSPNNSHDLAAAERRSARALTAAAFGAADGQATALIASIAASHQAHHDLLSRKPFGW